MSRTVRPALESSKEYGNCSESLKQQFLYGVDHFLSFLNSEFVAFSKAFRNQFLAQAFIMISPHATSASTSTMISSKASSLFLTKSRLPASDVTRSLRLKKPSACG